MSYTLLRKVHAQFTNLHKIDVTNLTFYIYNLEDKTQVESLSYVDNLALIESWKLNNPDLSSNALNHMMNFKVRDNDKDYTCYIPLHFTTLNTEIPKIYHDVKFIVSCNDERCTLICGLITYDSESDCVQSAECVKTDHNGNVIV